MYDFEKNGVGLINLNEQEILNAVFEMEGRLNDLWVDAENDSKIQEKFWDTMKQSTDFSQYHGIVCPDSRLSAHFGRRHANWYFD